MLPLPTSLTQVRIHNPCFIDFFNQIIFRLGIVPILPNDKITCSGSHSNKWQCQESALNHYTSFKEWSDHQIVFLDAVLNMQELLITYILLTPKAIVYNIWYPQNTSDIYSKLAEKITLN